MSNMIIGQDSSEAYKQATTQVSNALLNEDTCYRYEVAQQRSTKLRKYMTIALMKNKWTTESVRGDISREFVLNYFKSEAFISRGSTSLSI